jgi:hypothetical protein
MGIAPLCQDPLSKKPGDEDGGSSLLAVCSASSETPPRPFFSALSRGSSPLACGLENIDHSERMCPFWAKAPGALRTADSLWSLLAYICRSIAARMPHA